MTRNEIIETFRAKLAGKIVKKLDMQEAMEDAIELMKHDKQHMSYLRQKIKKLKCENDETGNDDSRADADSNS